MEKEESLVLSRWKGGPFWIIGAGLLNSFLLPGVDHLNGWRFFSFQPDVVFPCHHLCFLPRFLSDTKGFFEISPRVKCPPPSDVSGFVIFFLSVVSV